MGYTKKPKFSHSKLNTFDSCGFKFKLQYLDKHFINAESLAIDLGVLIHHCEESIFNILKEGGIPDYTKLKEEFMNINVPKKDQYDTEGGIFGINILKEKYKVDFYKIDKNGSSYYTKVLDYLSKGIYRLENYLKSNPDLVPYGAEQYYEMDYNGYFFSGYIDRIFYNTKDQTYIIEDIKTKGRPFKDQDLATPLQLAIYTMGLAKRLDIPEDKITCVYDLPLCGIKQQGGTKGFMHRARRKIDQLFADIEAEAFIPNPSPICYYCPFGGLNPELTEEGKNLCPYHSLWKPDNKTYNVASEWKGKEQHEEVLKKYIDSFGKSQYNNSKDEFDDF